MKPFNSFFTLILLSLFFSGSSFAADLIVKSGGLGGAYPTISSALAAATDGDRLIIYNDPYPSPMDWDQVVLPPEIDNAIYFWEPNRLYGGNYRAYVNGVGSHASVSGQIAGMQAVMIHNNSPGSNVSISLDNSVRTEDINPRYYRIVQHPLLRLQAEANGISDETVLYFPYGATSAFDPATDAYKVFGTDRAGLSVASMGDDATEYIIQGLDPEGLSELSVPIVVEQESEGVLTFRLTELSAIPYGVDLYFEDAIGYSQRIEEGFEYSTFLNAGKHDNRFFLRRTPTVAGELPFAKIYGSGMNVFIQFLEDFEGEANVSVFDVSGRLLLQSTVEAVQLQSLDLGDVSPGYYLVHVQMADRNSKGKVLLSE
jgi:hypothetical protein